MRVMGPSLSTLAVLTSLLTIGTGVIDAVAVTVLNDTFASVMTGNIVLLGVGIGAGSGAAIATIAVAATGYVSGVLLGTAFSFKVHRNGRKAVWPLEATRIFTTEAVVTALLAAFWFLINGEPTSREVLLAALLAAIAMGLQSAGVRTLGANVATTYMTGALTGVIENIITRTVKFHDNTRTILSIVSLAFGAVIGIAVLSIEPRAVFIVPLATLVIVITGRHIVGYPHT